MVLYLYLHFAYVAMTCIQTLKFMYEIQVLHGSADTCCGLLGYDTIQPGTWISTSSQRNTQFQCSGQKCFLKTHYSENISKHSHLRSVAFLCQITTVRSLQCGIKFTIWSTLLPQYGTDSEQFRQHIKKSYKFINFEVSLPRCVDQLYNQERCIKYMVRIQLYIFTQNSTYSYMFRPYILAIVSLYFKLNKQLYNMCMGYPRTYCIAAC